MRLRATLLTLAASLALGTAVAPQAHAMWRPPSLTCSDNSDEDAAIQVTVSSCLVGKHWYWTATPSVDVSFTGEYGKYVTSCTLSWDLYSRGSRIAHGSRSCTRSARLSYGKPVGRATLAVPQGVARADALRTTAVVDFAGYRYQATSRFAVR